MTAVPSTMLAWGATSRERVLPTPRDAAPADRC